MDSPQLHKGRKKMHGGYWVECTYPDGTLALINLDRVAAIERYEQ